MARTAGALLAGLLLALLPAARAADAITPEGTWKFILPFSRKGAQTLWLIQLEKKGGKWAGAITAHADGWPKGALEKVSVADGVLSFTIKMPDLTVPCTVRLPRDKADTLYGTASLGKTVAPLEMEKTSLTSLTNEALLKETLAKHPTGHQAIQAALALVQQAKANKAKAEEVRGWAAKAARVAEAYGPRWYREILLEIAQVLTAQNDYAPIALEYARKAERLLEPKERPSAQKQVLDVLAQALRAAGKDKEAKEVEARVNKLDFTIKTKTFAGRKGKSDRTVLVELFTGAEYKPAVAADLAFDALGKTFKPPEVVLLEYHLNFPMPDPLAAPDNDARVRLYMLQALPALFVDGKAISAAQGGVSEAPDLYDAFIEAIEPVLEKPAGAQVKLNVRRKGGKIEARVKVSGVEDKADAVLRLALVEEKVAYKGGNGVAVYHHVVRGFLGDPKGYKLTGDKPVSKTIEADPAEVRKKLKDYLDKVGKQNPFPNKERPLALENLKVVAFVQNDETRAVLQAAQAAVPGD